MSNAAPSNDTHTNATRTQDRRPGRSLPPVSLIGAPTDIGAGDRGALMGPEALRVAGLAEALADRGVDVVDRGNLSGPRNPWTAPVEGYRHLEQVVAWNRLLMDAVAAELRAGRMPIVLGGDAPAITPTQIRQIGIRSVDQGEKRLIQQHGLDVYDMRYIDEVGMKRTMEEALRGVDDNTHVHVSFDVDFLDPSIAPGVGTTVPGGPNYREAQLVMEMIADTGRMGSLDIVELNPALDSRNATALLAVDLVESLFGKSTLMRD